MHDIGGFTWGEIGAVIGVILALWGVGAKLIDRFKSKISDPLSIDIKDVRHQLAELQTDFKEDSVKRRRNDKLIFDELGSHEKRIIQNEKDIEFMKERNK